MSFENIQKTQKNLTEIKTLFLYLILNFTCLSVHSQILEGFIFDDINQGKLPYVNISLKNIDKGTYSNLKGFYRLNLDSINTKDSLIISHIGYHNKSIPLSSFESDQSYNLDIGLLPKDEKLDEVILSSKKMKYEWFSRHLGTHRKTTFTSSVPFGTEVAAFIKNDENKIAKIKDVKFKLRQSEKDEINTFKTYYRISFYKQNKIHFPGELLTFEDIIIQPENKTQTIKINLESKNLYLPKNDLFIGIKTINPDEISPKNSMYLTSPSLLYTHVENKITFKRYRGKQWHKDTRTSVFKKEHYKVPFVKMSVIYIK